MNSPAENPSSVLVNVKMPPRMVKDLDAIAKRKDMTSRSDLIRFAVRELLNREAAPTAN